MSASALPPAPFTISMKTQFAIIAHIQSDAMPLQEALIVEMGKKANGSSVNELLSLML